MFPQFDSFKVTLKAIAEALNGRGITWCIGASSSLYVQGVAVTPKDLDIIVDIEQFGKVCELLEGLRPGERQEGEFGNDKYYKVELKAAAFPAEIAGFAVNKDTLVGHTWEGIETTVHPLDYELEMYKQRRGKEHIVALIEQVLEK